MKRIMNLLRKSSIPKQNTLEIELEIIGYEIEEARIKGKSMSGELRERILKSQSWAQASGMSDVSIRYFTEEGAARARRTLR